MKTKTVAVNTSEDISKLVDLASRVKGDIEISTNDNVKYNAASILGLFSVKPGSALAVKYPETAEEFDDFLTTLELSVATRF